MANVKNFKFSKSEFASADNQDWSYEEIGQLGKIQAMKGKRITFTKKNLKGVSRVTLQIFPAKYKTLKEAVDADSVEKISCTKPLSATVREAVNKKVELNKLLSWLLTLTVQQSIDKPELYFLFSEKGDGEALPSFLIDELADEPVEFAELW